MVALFLTDFSCWACGRLSWAAGNNGESFGLENRRAFPPAVRRGTKQ